MFDIDSIRTASIAVVIATLVVLAGCSGGSSVGAQGDGGNVGYSVGGAKDANNFRDNVENDYLPLESDLTHEGLFYDYSFDTKAPRKCEQLFCPTYSRGVTRDPLSNETEHYMTVGLNSNVDREEFQRKKLNLVVVLDVSGSMDSPFDQYYYDEDGQKVETDQRAKMAAAKEALQGLLDHLEADDRVGIVLYDDDARTLVEMERVGERDMEVVRSKVDDVDAGGGTNLAAGMDRARSMLEPYADADPGEYENRVVYVTDAMPNIDAGSEGLASRLSEDAQRGIHSTFVGVGVDFNTELVETISDVRGANYYAVHSADQFAERMDEQFEYMVTPLVFDLSLSVESEGWKIAEVYGSPEAEAATGELMHVDTLFPSPTENGSTKGGVILVELERTGEAEEIRLEASYENRRGETRRTTRTVRFTDREPEYFETTAVRKAVLLTRYANLMQNWVAYERARLTDGDPGTPGEGIEASEDRDLGRWERKSTALQVSPVYRERIDRFADHFEAEMEAIGDEDLQRELEILRKLRDHGTDSDDGDGESTPADEEDATTGSGSASVAWTVPTG